MLMVQLFSARQERETEILIPKEGKPSTPRKKKKANLFLLIFSKIS